MVMRRMVLGALLVVAVTTAACAGSCSRAKANLTGWSQVCIDGVAYLQFPSGVTVKYDQEGRVARCR